MPMYKTQEAQNRWHCSLFLVPTKYLIEAAVGTNRTQHKKTQNNKQKTKKTKRAKHTKQHNKTKSKTKTKNNQKS